MSKKGKNKTEAIGPLKGDYKLTLSGTFTSASGTVHLKCLECDGTGRVRVYHKESSYQYHYEDCPKCRKIKPLENKLGDGT